LDKVPGVSDDARPAFGDLGDTFDRLQPFSPMVERAFGRGGALSQVVSPYAPEASNFFTNVTRALQEGNDNYRWLNIIVLTNGTENITDGIGAPVRDPFQTRDPQPRPGQSAGQRQGLPGPNAIGGAGK
jgi:hypothetical protein